MSERVTATLGIDLAAQAANTGICRIDWSLDGSGYVHVPGGYAADPDVIAMILRDDVTRVGIDAPFGWPVAFVDAVVAYRDSGAWPDEAGSDEHQVRMRLRATDWAVRAATGLVPLSVATDRIAIAAMRCARLLVAYHDQAGGSLDRSGTGRCVEVYPAAALKRWGVSPKFSAEDPGSYKGPSPAATQRRRRLMKRMVAAADGWLEIPEKAVIVCCEDDNCLDSMLCALVARAAELGRVEPAADPILAALEGWIVLPLEQTLADSCR